MGFTGKVVATVAAIVLFAAFTWLMAMVVVPAAAAVVFGAFFVIGMVMEWAPLIAGWLLFVGAWCLGIIIFGGRS